MKTIPGVFLSHDRYLDAALFCLRQYARLWDSCPIRFLVPGNSDAAVARIQEESPRGLHVDAVRCDVPIRTTFDALDRAAGDAEWLFWCSSDRYPIAAMPDALNRLAQEILSLEAEKKLAELSAIRIVRWKDMDMADVSAAPVSVGGEQFRATSKPNVGFWHPQFIRRDWLKRLVRGLADNAVLSDVQSLIAYLKSQEPPKLMCTRGLMKLEEPIRNGLATLNYAARRAREGKGVDGLEIERATVAYSCLHAHQANTFWQKAGHSSKSVLGGLAGEGPDRVVSVGGVGSKRIASWLYPGASMEVRSRLHSHTRIPPCSLPAGVRAIYVFGDPRNTVQSIFKRREIRHERHGFLDVNPLRENPAIEFAMLHARNLQVDPAPMTEDWDLSEYLRQQVDVFRLEEHLDFWMYANAPYEIVFVRYETLWANASRLGSYLGVRGEMPVFLPRSSDWQKLDSSSREMMDQVHGPFAQRLNTLPDLFKAKNGVVTTLDGDPLFLGAI